MKHNYKSIICEIMEYIVLIAPTAGYSIYCYADTLQYTMSEKSKGMFWTLISLVCLLAVLYSLFKKKYKRYVDGYVQQKTDLEVHPDNELLIKKVAEKSTIIENIDLVMTVIPLLLVITVLTAFQNAIEQLLMIFEILAGSIMAKVCLHCLTIHFEKVGMFNKLGGKGNGENAKP